MNTEIDEKVTNKIKKSLEECEGGSWPCPRCEKFFQGENFVLNHIMKKHSQKVLETKKKIKAQMMLENYSNDKNKIIGPAPTKIDKPKDNENKRSHHHHERNGRGGYRRNAYRDQDDPEAKDYKNEM